MKKSLIFLLLVLYLPIYLYGFLLEDFENTGSIPYDWNTLSITAEGIPGIMGKAYQLTYTFAGDKDYFFFYKTYNDISLIDGDQIRFWYKGTGGANTVELYLEDSAGNNNIHKLNRVSNNPNWSQAIFPLSNFSSLDKQNIKTMKIAISQQSGDDGGNGSIIIDEVGLYQSIDQTAITNLIDNFNGTDSDMTNILGGVSTYYTSPVWSKFTVTNYSENFCTIKLTYTNTLLEAAWLFTIQNTTATDVSAYQYLEFKIKADINGRGIGIGLKDNTIEKYYQPSSLTTDWQTIQIPLSAFSAQGINLSRIYQVQFWLMEDRSELNIPKPTGDVYIYIDDLQFVTPSKTSGLVSTIDKMDLPLDVSSWDKESGSGTSVSASLVDGYNNKALKLDYTLSGTGSYVRINRDFYLNMLAGGGVQFYIKGDQANHNLEVKLKDSDNTVYIRKFFNFTDTDNTWRKVGFDYNQLYSYSAGSDEDLNLKKIKQIDVVVVKANNQPSSGVVAFDELRCEPFTGFEKEWNNNKVIQELKIDPIPFSPNNDGYNDTVSFYFLLKQKAKINLRIYDLAGNIIKEFAQQEFTPGSEIPISWDGKDYSNKIVKNGIFFFQFKAQGEDGTVEKVNQGIAVMK